MKKKIIAQIKNADISHDGWAYKVVDNCEDKYAAGYLAATIAKINEYHSQDEELFREELLEVCNFGIWNK